MYVKYFGKASIIILFYIIPNICGCDALDKSSYDLLSISSKSLFKDFCDVVDNDAKKVCLVQTQYWPIQVWKQWTGYYCYNYTNPIRLNYVIPVKLGQFCDQKYKFPYSQADGEIFWFDYSNISNWKHIRPSFKSDDFFSLWMDCCEKAVDCCINYMTNTNIVGDEDTCPVIWDAWTCFPRTQSGTIARMPCSKQAYSTTGTVCECMLIYFLRQWPVDLHQIQLEELLKSEKECYQNGTWNQITDYGVCAIAPVLRLRHNYHIIFLATAIALAAPAAIIFFSYHRLKTITRICLHRNLILAIIIRNILTITVKKIIILDALESNSNHVMADNGVPCRILAFFENCAKNGIYACMLVDGFYLHKSIVRSFANEPKLKYLYAVVATLTFLPSLIWAIVRGSKQAQDCWMVDTNNDQWIPDGFRFAILGANIILFGDIMRVMFSKLKSGNVTQHLKTTFRATLFLLPLFGIHIIVIANRNIVASNTCGAENLYYYFSYGLEGCQGIFVALMFCYMSSEVHHELLGTYKKLSNFFEERFGCQLPQKQTLRRDTAATYIFQEK